MSHDDFLTYFIHTGDENSADQMANFCNQFAELYGAYKNGEHLDNVKPADVGMDKSMFCEACEELRREKFLPNYNNTTGIPFLGSLSQEAIDYVERAMEASENK